MFRPEATLNPRALRREAIQLGTIAAASLIVRFLDVRVLEVIAGIVDVLVAVITSIAAVVAWRVGGRGFAFGLYAVAAVAFLGLAVANIAA